jgi:hypothetical protein
MSRVQRGYYLSAMMLLCAPLALFHVALFNAVLFNAPLFAAEEQAGKTGNEKKQTANSAPSPAPAQASPAGKASASTEGKIKLAFKFVPNQVVHQEVEHEMELVTTFQGETETAKNKSMTRRSHRVIAVGPDGSGDLELKIERVHMIASFDDKNEPLEFQSDDPLKHPAKFDHIKKMIGKPTAIIRFTPNGKVAKVLFSEKFSSVEPPPEKAAVDAGKAQEGATSPGVNTGADGYFFTLPDEPVAVGQTWKERYDVMVLDSDKLPHKIAMQRVYKLTDLKENLATIEFRTAILTPVNDPGFGVQLIQRETAGRVLFDVEQGQIVSRDSSASKTVIDAVGPGSALRAKSVYHEQTIRATIAAKP